MASVATDMGFIVWGNDQTTYGPVEYPTLVASGKADSDTADTWVYAGKSGSWQKAGEIRELQMFFRSRASGNAGSSSANAVNGVDIRALRRVKILANMTDAQLERFAQFMVVEQVPQWAII